MTQFEEEEKKWKNLTASETYETLSKGLISMSLKSQKERRKKLDGEKKNWRNNGYKLPKLERHKFTDWRELQTG